MDRCTQAPPPARILAATYTGNSFEICWDCPCHGSQFGTDGAVLNGPAIHPLEEVPVESEEADAEIRRAS